MKKGLVSLDILIAIIIVIFLVIWLENFSTATVKEVNQFGVQVQANALAIGIGTQLNNFYAISPDSGDYLDIGNSIEDARNFSSEDPMQPALQKSGNTLTVGVFTSTATYPVSTAVLYNPESNQVTES